LLAVAAAGEPALGNPLNAIDGPVVVVALFTIVADNVISVEPDEDPLSATVWIGVTKELDVHVVVELTTVVLVTPVRIFFIVPFE